RMKAVLLTAAVPPRTPTPPAWAMPPSRPPGPAMDSFPVTLLSVNWSELLEKTAPPVALPPDVAPAPPSARLLRKAVPLTVTDPPEWGAARAPPPAEPPEPPGESPATAWLPLRTESVTTAAGPNEAMPPPSPKPPRPVRAASPPRARLSLTTLWLTV